MSRARNRALRYSFAGDRGWTSRVESVEADTTPIDHGDLRHGLDLNDLNAAASIAIRTNYRLAGDPAERYDIAWCGAAEHLYASTETVTRQDLVVAASRALDRALNSEYATYGVGRQRLSRQLLGRGSAPRFAAYWAQNTTPSQEERVVESLALAQIWALMAPGERAALAALAAHAGNGHAAAEALGLSLNTFYTAITRGRTRFKRLWLGGETPPVRRAKTGKALRIQNAHRARKRRSANSGTREATSA